MSKAVIQCDNIEIAYSGKPVLGPLSLHVHEGDFWGIAGPNGAGKSTLIKAIAGMEKTRAGQISIRGEDIHRHTGILRHAIGKRVGMLMQHHEFYPDLPISAEDVVYFGRTAINAAGRRFSTEDHNAVNEAFEELELGHLRKRPYRELSGGEKRKVHLARLSAQKAEIVLLDEPTAGLDLDWQERLTRLVGDFFLRHKITVLMVTHDIDRLPSCCNSVLLLKRGVQVAVGPPSEVFTGETLSSLYNCRIEVHEYMGRYHAFSLGTEDE